MTEYAIYTVEGVLEEIDTLISQYERQRDINDEKGLEKMAISYQGSALGLKMLKSSITGEEFENTWWLK